MSTQKSPSLAYSITETSHLTGLTTSTLRYYETIGLIPPVGRDVSSHYRVYSEADIDYIVSIACLSATGMSIDAMKTYLLNVEQGIAAAGEQIRLLDTQNQRLAQEAAHLALRRSYLTTKAAYWQAIAAGDEWQAATIAQKAVSIAKQVKLTNPSH